MADISSVLTGTLSFTTLGKIIRRWVMKFFLFFCRKYALTLHTNCLLQSQFARSVKAYFRNNSTTRKVFQNVVSRNFYQSASRYLIPNSGELTLNAPITTAADNILNIQRK